MGRFATLPWGPVTQGVIDTANTANDLRGALKRGRNLLLTGTGRMTVRPGTRVAMTLLDDVSGTPGVCTTVCALTAFMDGALAVAHSTVTQKAYLYRLAADLAGWYDAAGTLHATASASPIGVLWSGMATAPNVAIAEGLGSALIAHADAATASALNWGTWTYDPPGTLTALTADLDDDTVAEPVYFSGVVAFHQHYWGLGFGGGTTAATGYDPSKLRWSQPDFSTTGGLFQAADSFTMGDHVKSVRDRAMAGVVAGDALFIGGSRSIARITGYGRDSWVRQVLDKSYGLIGPKAAVAAGDTLHWWSARGPMRCTDQGMPQPLWDGIPAAVAAQLAGGAAQNVVAAFDRDRDQVLYTYQSAASEGQIRQCAFDIRREVWMGPDQSIGTPIFAAGAVDPLYVSTASQPGPAAPPSGVTTANVTATSATVSWTPGDIQAESYVEYRKTGDAAYTTVGPIAPNQSSVALAGLVAGTPYDPPRVHHRRNGQDSSTSTAGAGFTTLASDFVSPPSNLALTAHDPLDRFDANGTVTWTNSGEAGVATAVYLAGPAASAPAAGAYALLGTAVNGRQSMDVGPIAQTGRYWVKIQHVRGSNVSAMVGPVSAALTKYSTQF